METQVIIRTIVLFIALVNQILVMFGLNPLPFSDEQIYEAATVVFTVFAALWGWWKNNSFSDEARKADEYMRELKEKKRHG